MANQQQPIYIMPEGTERYRGRDAHSLNILAGKILSNTLKATLGPKGMDKMLVDDSGYIIVTNDGATILQEMDIAHPAARMLVEVAKKQDSEVGDGTTTAVIIAGELLRKAEELMSEGIHASSVIIGYRKALAKALETLEEISIDGEDEETLKKVAITTMYGKGSESSKEFLADLLVEAVMKVAENDTIEKTHLNIQRVEGGSIEDSEIVNGIAIDSTRASKSMPEKIENAKVALLKYPLEIKDLETSAKIDITNPAQMQAFIDNEEEMIREMVDKIASTGANVVFCQKGIDELALHYLSRKGIFAVKRTKNTDMTRLEKSTGAKIVTNINDLSSDDLGEAGTVFEDHINKNALIFVEDTKDAKAVSIILRGSTKYVIEEIERGIEDALGVLLATIEDKKVLVGAGAPEIKIASELKKYAPTVGGREQLAINAFAEAIEVIPQTLADNAGLDSIDILVSLRSEIEKSAHMGINIKTGKVSDMGKEGILEPQRVKKHALQAASDATEMILRIDDMIAAKGALESTGPDESMGGQMPGGMPPGTTKGMPGIGGTPPMM